MCESSKELCAGVDLACLILPIGACIVFKIAKCSILFQVKSQMITISLDIIKIKEYMTEQC